MGAMRRDSTSDNKFISSRRAQDGQLLFSGTTIPIYGPALRFEGECGALVKDRSGDTVAYLSQLGGKPCVRVGYDLFREVRTLLVARPAWRERFDTDPGFAHCLASANDHRLRTAACGNTPCTRWVLLHCVSHARSGSSVDPQTQAGRDDVRLSVSGDCDVCSEHCSSAIATEKPLHKLGGCRQAAVCLFGDR